LKKLLSKFVIQRQCLAFQVLAISSILIGIVSLKAMAFIPEYSAYKPIELWLLNRENSKDLYYLLHTGNEEGPSIAFSAGFEDWDMITNLSPQQEVLDGIDIEWEYADGVLENTSYGPSGQGIVVRFPNVGVKSCGVTAKNLEPPHYATDPPKHISFKCKVFNVTATIGGGMLGGGVSYLGRNMDDDDLTGFLIIWIRMFLERMTLFQLQ
jgi:hypothetical protein